MMNTNAILTYETFDGERETLSHAYDQQHVEKRWRDGANMVTQPLGELKCRAFCVRSRGCIL